MQIGETIVPQTSLELLEIRRYCRVRRGRRDCVFQAHRKESGDNCQVSTAVRGGLLYTNTYQHRINTVSSQEAPTDRPGVFLGKTEPMIAACRKTIQALNKELGDVSPSFLKGLIVGHPDATWRSALNSAMPTLSPAHKPSNFIGISFFVVHRRSSRTLLR